MNEPGPTVVTGGRKLRVLQVIPALYFGGAERVVVSLATGLDSARFESAVCCTRGFGPLAEPLRAAGVQVALAGEPPHPHPYLASIRLRDVVKRLRPDIVHTHGMTALFQAGPLGLARRLPPWVHTFHFGNYPHVKRRYLLGERLMSALPQQLVAVSEAQRESIIRHIGVASRRIVTLPNGVQDPGVDHDASARDRTRKEFGFGPDVTVVGTVAVLSEQKGIPVLLEAAAALVRTDRRLRFLIVGGGPLEGALRQRATALGLDSSVVLTGWRPDVAELVRALDVYVMPSLWEAMPLALLEAMAAGRPVVVTKVGDNGRIVQDGVSGLLIAPGESSEIVAAVRRLTADPGLAALLGAGARQRFAQNYTVPHMVASYERLYATVAVVR